MTIIFLVNMRYALYWQRNCNFIAENEIEREVRDLIHFKSLASLVGLNRRDLAEKILDPKI